MFHSYLRWIVILVDLFVGGSAQAILLNPQEHVALNRWMQARFEEVPENARHEPGLVVLTNYGPVQRHTRDGQKLRIGKTMYIDGLYCHAPSHLRVYLPAPAKSFTAQVGIDTNGSWSGGSVIFLVKAEGKEVYRSETCRRGEPARTVNVNMNGTSVFDLIVGDSGDNINSDQADWADALIEVMDGTQLRLGDLPILTDETEPPDRDPPFSFIYGGRPFSELREKWKLERFHRKIDTHGTERILAWSDPDTKLTVRCVAVEYADFPVIEWTLQFRNDGASDTPIIEAVEALDLRFQVPVQGDVLLRSNSGDNCTPDSYAPTSESLKAGHEKRIANTGGRPTQIAFPYFNLVWPDRGIIVVLSWAGQWSMVFERDAGAVLRIHGGQQTTHFKLHPGESARGPMAVLLFYQGDWLRGQNLWRRWMVLHNLPRPGGKLVMPMASLCTGNFYPGLMSNAAKELEFLRRHIEEGIRFDAWWQDAGWYPCDGVTWPKTGTWEVDRARFPNGLQEVSDFVHAAHMKSIVWFEPERVHPETWLAEQHPEWIYGGAKGGLLKLGDPVCRAWAVDHIDRLLTEQKIDVYRQDFNIDPLTYWQAADSDDRRGMAEIRHVEGYFAFWDELRRRHPDLLIDSCASGGRRNDLETLRRAVPLLRSDWYAAPDGQQCHTYGLSLWFPYQGTGAYLYNQMNGSYWVRSGMVAEFTFGPDATGLEKVDWGLLRNMLDEWRAIKECFYGDFYPLTSYSPADDVWMGWQYSLPESGKGVVQMFRRGGSCYEMGRFRLRDLDADARYAIRDFDGIPTLELPGKELMAAGLLVTMPDRASAKTLTYQRVEEKRREP